MKHLYFVRHGQSQANLDRVFAGQMDSPLTDLGRSQAHEISKSVKLLNIDLIVSSPLLRALETAQIIAKDTGYPVENIVVNSTFKEHFIGSLAGKPWGTYEEFDARIADMESEADLEARAKKGLLYLKSLPQGNVLLVGHGSFARKLQSAIDPLQDYPEPPNAKVVQLI